MTFSKIVLGFTGLMFAVYGVYCVISPDGLAEITGLAFRNPRGHTEVRAMYGGLQIGFGLFLLYALTRPKLLVPALVATLLIVGVTALTRLGGISSMGGDPYNNIAVVYELVTTALVAAALRRETTPGIASAA